MDGAGLVSGTVFAGYRIERLLGRGGMGTVYLAGHPRLPRSVALKLLNRDLYADDEVRRRFEREADVAARLDHPNIVAVLDRGVEAGQLWISMQYVDGPDASGFAGEPLDPRRAVRIIEQTADALDYAHGRGVLHRDVKPANILLTRGRDGDRVLLGDFGIARLRDDQQQLTRTGELLATLAYAAPEQLSDRPVDHRADQYALGCTLYALLTGHAPFAATNPGAMVAAHLTQAVPSASAAVPRLGPAIDTVIARAMAKRPEDRFGTCSELAAAAHLALTGEHHAFTGESPNVPAATVVRIPQPPVAPPPPPTLWNPALTPPANPVPAQVSSRWRTASVLLLALALVAVAGIGAAGVYWKFLRPAGPRAMPWGYRHSLAVEYPRLIPADPAGTGWRGARCSAVGTVVAMAGDPIPTGQIICTQPDGVTIWYTRYDRSQDVDSYLDAHTVRVDGERDIANNFGSMVLQRPKDPAAPFTLATYGWTTPGMRESLVEISWPGHTFEEVRDQWWQDAPF
ncbi:serine/threonine-protein kinase [Nocardia concava]|uniref:serine/threonine-protein kinase n=1 Tax=Nocardia concava TaxID=257281 RepID=UPI001FE11BD3|nr:serine/threonine-protein kinase [Nocardia concava]